jgi:hypothetical protein
MALALDVLTLYGRRVTEITALLTPATRGPGRERFAADRFKRFGLPTDWTDSADRVLAQLSRNTTTNSGEVHLAIAVEP